jgi:hypothetical protein
MLISVLYLRPRDVAPVDGVQVSMGAGEATVCNTTQFHFNQRNVLSHIHILKNVTASNHENLVRLRHVTERMMVVQPRDRPDATSALACLNSTRFRLSLWIRVIFGAMESAANGTFFSALIHKDAMSAG